MSEEILYPEIDGKKRIGMGEGLIALDRMVGYLKSQEFSVTQKKLCDSVQEMSLRGRTIIIDKSDFESADDISALLERLIRGQTYFESRLTNNADEKYFDSESKYYASGYRQIEVEMGRDYKIGEEMAKASAVLTLGLLHMKEFRLIRDNKDCGDTNFVEANVGIRKSNISDPEADMIEKILKELKRGLKEVIYY